MVWGENVHERKNPLVRKIYPRGMHTTIAQAIAADKSLKVSTATLQQPGWPNLSATANVTVVEPWGDPPPNRRELHLVSGPGITPKFSETPCAVRWSGPWDDGSHNRDVYGGLLGLSDEQLDELRAEGVV